MEHSLALKVELCEQAEALSVSEDWKHATDELIALQAKWKEAGAVSRRHSDQIWKRFRAACDKFFERKAAHFSSIDSEYEENLRLKRELIEEMKGANIKAGVDSSVESSFRTDHPVHPEWKNVLGQFLLHL